MAGGKGDRNPDFLKLWAGQSVSVVGSQITLVALPLAAVLVLDAGAAEMGLLRALGTLPTVLFSLAVGVWIDRVRRRPLMIGSNLGSALFLGLIPALGIAGVLRMEHLYAIAFAVGVLEVIFVIAYQAYLPSLVSREGLVDANSKVQMSGSAAQIGGPAAAGVLVSILTAPIAIVVDAVSFLVAALSLAWIGRPEPEPLRRPRALLRELQEGFAGLLGHPVLRPYVIATSAALLAYSIYLSLIVLFHVRTLGLDSVAVGIVFGIGGVGALAGAALAPRLARRIGIGPSMVLALVLAAGGLLVTSQAAGPATLAVTVAAVGQFTLLFGASLFNVNGPALRAAVTPAHVLGRVNATYRFVVWGMFPVGALLGGAIGEALGLRAPIIVGASICVVALLGFSRSQVSRMREAPRPAEA
jgi:MFS family permease